jgi:hypothetical protein
MCHRLTAARFSRRFFNARGQSMAKRRSSSSFNFRTTAPKENTTIFSIIIFAVGVIAWAFSIVSISPYIPWLLAVAYLLLLAGVLMRNL